jgi:hypothetical protein
MSRAITSHKVSVDREGSIVMTGSFYGIYDFDPGTAVLNLSADESSKTIFTSKWSEKTIIKK